MTRGRMCHAYAKTREHYSLYADYAMVRCTEWDHECHAKGGLPVKVTEEDGALRLYCFACAANDDVRETDFERAERVLTAELFAKCDNASFADWSNEPMRDYVETTSGPEQRSAEDARAIAKARTLWSQGVENHEVILRYLETRGLNPALNGHIRFRRDKKNRRKGWMMGQVINRHGEHTATTNKAFDLQSYTRWPDEDWVRWTQGRFQGGVIPLYPWQKVIGLAEGIETAWSVAALTGIPCQAVHGTWYGATYLPPIVEEVIIFADRGDKGERDAAKGAAIFKRKGLRASVQCSKPFGDFNDVLIKTQNIQKETEQ